MSEATIVLGPYALLIILTALIGWGLAAYVQWLVTHATRLTEQAEEQPAEAPPLGLW